MGKESTSSRRDFKEHNLTDPKLVNKPHGEGASDATSEGDSGRNHDPATRRIL